MCNQNNPRGKDSRAESAEERVKRVTIGGPTELNGPVTLVSYDAEWPLQFEAEAERIRAALGDRALRVEHVGSTSVPNLVAKPIIDILLVVQDSSNESGYAPALQTAGYVLRIREPEWHEHRLFKGPGVNINLHVFTVGSVEIDRLLLLRDHLRSSPAERQWYEQVKRELASRTWKYVQEYADAKSEVIEAILTRARTG